MPCAAAVAPGVTVVVGSAFLGASLWRLTSRPGLTPCAFVKSRLVTHPNLPYPGYNGVSKAKCRSGLPPIKQSSRESQGHQENNQNLIKNNQFPSQNNQNCMDKSDKISHLIKMDIKRKRRRLWRRPGDLVFRCPSRSNLIVF